MQYAVGMCLCPAGIVNICKTIIMEPSSLAECVSNVCMCIHKYVNLPYTIDFWGNVKRSMTA